MGPHHSHVPKFIKTKFFLVVEEYCNQLGLLLWILDTVAFHATMNDGDIVPFDSAVIFDDLHVNIGNG